VIDRTRNVHDVPSGFSPCLSGLATIVAGQAGSGNPFGRECNDFAKTDVVTAS
jgi:hypothetical protein